MKKLNQNSHKIYNIIKGYKKNSSDAVKNGRNRFRRYVDNISGEIQGQILRGGINSYNGIGGFKNCCFGLMLSCKETDCEKQSA